jgi:hypothetical protein
VIYFFKRRIYERIFHFGNFCQTKNHIGLYLHQVASLELELEAISWGIPQSERITQQRKAQHLSKKNVINMILLLLPIFD